MLDDKVIAKLSKLYSESRLGTQTECPPMCSLDLQAMHYINMSKSKYKCNTLLMIGTRNVIFIRTRLISQ